MVHMPKWYILGRLVLNPSISLFYPFLSFILYLYLIIPICHHWEKSLPCSCLHTQSGLHAGLPWALRAWGRKTFVRALGDRVLLWITPLFSPEPVELCAHLCRERSSSRHLAACARLLGGKESESAFVLFSGAVTSVCHLFAARLLWLVFNLP